MRRLRSLFTLLDARAIRYACCRLSFCLYNRLFLVYVLSSGATAPSASVNDPAPQRIVQGRFAHLWARPLCCDCPALVQLELTLT